MAQARKGKKKVSKTMGEILKAPKKAEKAVKHASKHWNDIESFRKSVIDSGLQLNVYDRWPICIVVQCCTGLYNIHSKHSVYSVQHCTTCRFVTPSPCGWPCL